jgi:hypothetical protein
MVLVYLPTKLGDFVRANVGKYSSTMEHMGMVYSITKIGMVMMVIHRHHFHH